MLKYTALFSFFVLGLSAEAKAGHCGGYGQACCTRGAACGSGLACQSGTCAPCGEQSQVCCAGNTCNSSTLACTGSGGSCQLCGGYGFPCCTTGTACTSPYVCQSNTCISVNTCTDGIKNGSETDVDCGGTCADCALGKHCLVSGDCAYPNNSCSGGTCVTATCTDGIKNGVSPCTLETDVDCGGTCGPCAEGKGCAVNPCCSGTCTQNADCTVVSLCFPPPDNLCWIGTCWPGSGCQSGVCGSTRGVCLPSSCANGVQDGAESDVDCGGGTCDLCNVGHHCLVNADCAWNICTGGVCTRY